VKRRGAHFITTPEDPKDPKRTKPGYRRWNNEVSGKGPRKESMETLHRGHERHDRHISNMREGTSSLLSGEII